LVVKRGRSSAIATDAMQPQPRLLHAVLRLGQRAGRRVGQPDKSRALSLERLRELLDP
jgi:hypothetical protein